MTGSRSPQRVTLDGEQVAACPDCDNAPVCERAGNPNATAPQHTYACYDCGWRGDAYNPREPLPDATAEGIAQPNEGTLAHELANADPGDLVTDGGASAADHG